MSSHVFPDMFLRIHWHVTPDRPSLTAWFESLVKLMSDRRRKLERVHVHGIGGTRTHVYVAASVAPKVRIGDMVQGLKGGSLHDANERLRNEWLYWQRGWSWQGELAKDSGVPCEREEASCSGPGA